MRRLRTLVVDNDTVGPRSPFINYLPAVIEAKSDERQRSVLLYDGAGILLNDDSRAVVKIDTTTEDEMRNILRSNMSRWVSIIEVQAAERQLVGYIADFARLQVTASEESCAAVEATKSDGWVNWSRHLADWWSAEEHRRRILQSYESQTADPYAESIKQNFSLAHQFQLSDWADTLPISNAVVTESSFFYGSSQLTRQLAACIKAASSFLAILKKQALVLNTRTKVAIRLREARSLSASLVLIEKTFFEYHGLGRPPRSHSRAWDMSLLIQAMSRRTCSSLIPA